MMASRKGRREQPPVAECVGRCMDLRHVECAAICHLLCREMWEEQKREGAIVLEQYARDALRGLSDSQLSSLRWVGLLDEGWTRMYGEMAERGISW
jgi:hypothetical protein